MTPARACAAACSRSRSSSAPTARRCCSIDALGKGFAVVEWDDGRLPLAPRGDERPLGASAVRVIPRDQRFVPASDAGVQQVRDLTGTVGAWFDHARVRGVVLRPDRYVAACLDRDAAADEADRALQELVRLSNSGTEATQRTLPLDLAIA